MIFTERTIKIKNGVASIDSPIVLYRGDREVEILFTIVNSKFKFSPEKGNYINEVQASFGQLAIDTPDGTDVFTDVAPCVDGTVTFMITGDMIDELSEIGFYSFHIRLFNHDQSSRITIPAIIEGIEIREPIVIEGDDNGTVAVADYGQTDESIIENEQATFLDENGKLDIKWKKGDIISSLRLNQMVQYINDNAVPGEQGYTPIKGVDYFTEEDINSLNIPSIEGLATETFVKDAIAESQLDGEVDLSDYATKDEIPSKVSDLENDSNFITEVDLNDKVWSLDNLGDDVKNAMTGGAIPIIEENSILGKHIVDKQISMNKTTFLEEYRVNLFDGSAIDNGVLNISTGKVETNTTYTTTGYIEIKNKTYKASKKVYSYALYNSEKVFISGKISDSNTITIDNENAKYIRCCVWGSNNSITWNFCEEEKYVNEYIPYDDPNNILITITDERLEEKIGYLAKNNVKAEDVIVEGSIQVPMTDFLYQHHVNLADPDRFTVDKYVGAGGNLGSYTGVCVTDFIEVEEGQSYIGGGDFSSGYYDADKNFIEIFSLSDDTNKNKGYWTVPTGKGIKYARVTVAKNGGVYKGTAKPLHIPAWTNNDIRFTQEEAGIYFKKYMSKLFGLKANFIGDSITQGTNADGKPYPYWISLEYGLACCRNYGIAGTKITTMENDNNQSMCVRYADMDDDADIVILFGGTNDRTDWLGTMDDREQNTFYGACHIIMKGLLEKYPGKRIGVVTPIKYAPTSSESQIVNALKEVAKYYNIPVCDLYNELGMCFNINNDIKSVYCPDGLHPSAEGHRIIARKIGAWIETL